MEKTLKLKESKTPIAPDNDNNFDVKGLKKYQKSFGKLKMCDRIHTTFNINNES